MNIDDLYSKVYNETNYNCLHFVTEAWERLTGEAIAERLASLLAGRVEGRRYRGAHHRAFEPLSRPESPCLAVMRRPRATPHVGIYLEGKMLHIQRRGVEYQPVDIAALGFTKVTYYK